MIGYAGIDLAKNPDKTFLTSYVNDSTTWMPTCQSCEYPLKTSRAVMLGENLIFVNRRKAKKLFKKGIVKMVYFEAKENEFSYFIADYYK